MRSSSLDLQENLGNRHVCLRLLCLERLQTKAARIILKDSNLSHHQLLCQLSWKSLKARSTMHNLTFVFKQKSLLSYVAEKKIVVIDFTEERERSD